MIRERKLKKSFIGRKNVSRKYFFCFSIAISVCIGCRSDENAPDLPWYSGTLLAFFPENVPPKTVLIEPYLAWTVTSGTYDDKGSFHKKSPVRELSSFLLLETGITEFLDITLFLEESKIQYRKFHKFLYGDTLVDVGLQILRDNPLTAMPDVRLVIEESFPTGTYKQLNPEANFSDASGIGSYETLCIFVTRKVFYPKSEHPFNINLNLGYGFFSKTKIQGYSIYGGNSETSGMISPGSEYLLNIGLEYSLSKHWVIGTDIHYIFENRSRFSGNPGSSPLFLPLQSQFSLAPCLEYNLNANLGAFFACWFTVAGRNTNKFVSNQFSAYYAF